MSASSTAAGSVIRVRAANSIGSPTASASITSLTERGQGADAGFDQLDQAGRHDRIADPPPIPVLLHEPAVGDLLLDDVAQIQNVAAGQLPQPLSGIRIHRSVQGRRQQRGGFVERQGLQVEPVELATLPYLLYRGGNRFTVANGEHHFRRAALHDLLHNECRQVIEQMHVIDTHHHRGAGGCGSQRLDHPAAPTERCR